VVLPKQSVIAGKSSNSRSRSRGKNVHATFGSKHFKKFTSVFGSQPTVAIIGLLTAFSLILTLVYQLGYLVTIDYRLMSPFTVQDAISSSIYAVPLISSFLLVGLTFAVLTDEKMDEIVYGDRRNEDDPVEQLIKKVVVWFLLALSFISLVVMFFVSYGFFLCGRVRDSFLKKESFDTGSGSLVAYLFGASDDSSCCLW
jgi:hypothetical protein